MFVYITIDYGSKDKDIIAKKQVFPAFSASLLGKTHFHKSCCHPLSAKQRDGHQVH
jgi:hypothetical protein